MTEQAAVDVHDIIRDSVEDTIQAVANASSRTSEAVTKASEEVTVPSAALLDSDTALPVTLPNADVVVQTETVQQDEPVKVQTDRPLRRAASRAKQLAELYTKHREQMQVKTIKDSNDATDHDEVPTINPQSYEFVEETLRRAEHDLYEEKVALKRARITMHHYLVNLYVTYVQWLQVTVSGSSGSSRTSDRRLAEAITFAVARHINVLVNDVTVKDDFYPMGMDLEIVYCLFPFVKQYEQWLHEQPKGAGHDRAAMKHRRKMMPKICNKLQHTFGLSQQKAITYATQWLTKPHQFVPGLSPRSFVKRLNSCNTEYLDQHSVSAGLRGPLAYTSNPTLVYIEDILNGEAACPPRGHSLGNQMLRLQGYVEGKKPLRSGDSGYQQNPLSIVWTNVK